MTLVGWANIAMIAESIFFILSLGFIWFQLRQNTRLTRTANTQKLVELSSPFNLQLAQDRSLAELWLRGQTEFNGLDNIDRYRYSVLLMWWLNLHENIYFQHQHGLIDKESYQAWANDLGVFVRVHDLGSYWSEWRPYYQQSFSTHIFRLIQTASTQK